MAESNMTEKTDNPKSNNLCPYCLCSGFFDLSKKERKTHEAKCRQEFLADFKRAFLVEESKKQQCAICRDIVLEKEPISAPRFAILAKCKHIFCLDCMRQWRSRKNLPRSALYGCPECRLISDSYYPSRYYVTDDEDKEVLRKNYLKGCKTIHCKYFNKGKGSCKFWDCRFLHQTVDEGADDTHDYNSESLIRRQLSAPIVRTDNFRVNDSDSRDSNIRDMSNWSLIWDNSTNGTNQSSQVLLLSENQREQSDEEVWNLSDLGEPWDPSDGDNVQENRNDQNTLAPTELNEDIPSAVSGYHVESLDDFWGSFNLDLELNDGFSLNLGLESSPSSSDELNLQYISSFDVVHLAEEDNENGQNNLDTVNAVNSRRNIDFQVDNINNESDAENTDEESSNDTRRGL